MTNFKKPGRRASYLVLILLMIFMAGCNSKKTEQSQFYSEADFQKLNKIDIHCHVNTARPAFMEQAVADNFRILTINTDAPIGVTIEQQQDSAIFQRKAFPNNLEYLTTFSMKGWDNDDWQEKAIAYVKESLKKGAIGVKVWKNIGMVEKDKNGNFIMIDDPKFDTIFNFLVENDIPVCGHLGEPRNCWLPIDSMTVNNDKFYFSSHPEYHMYLHPEFPSYEEQVAARDRMLEKHPNMKFMGAHLGSMEWSTELMAEHFDQFPNMTVDLAERISHIQALTLNDWQKVRDFFIKYQDRIIYGTDRGDYVASEKDPEKLKAKVHEDWISDWKFLTTDEPMTSTLINGQFNGLRLPKEVIDKIYYKNAERMFHAFKNS